MNIQKDDNNFFIKLKEEVKLDIVKNNVNIFDVFSEDIIKKMLDMIQLDEKERLEDTRESSRATKNTIGRMQDEIILDIREEHDAIKYVLYASELSLQAFLDEFEGYIDNANGYNELDAFIKKVNSQKLVIL